MKANYSIERRGTALSWLRGEGVLEDTTLSPESVLMAAIGLIICNEAGIIKQADLDEAITDPSVVNYARQLVAEAREPI